MRRTLRPLELLVAAAHGGTVTVTSRRGHTEFTVTVPAAGG